MMLIRDLFETVPPNYDATLTFSKPGGLLPWAAEIKGKDAKYFDKKAKGEKYIGDHGMIMVADFSGVMYYRKR